MSSLSGFVLEKQLVSALRKKLASLFGDSYLFTRQEWSLGGRIADIAVCSFHAKPSTKGLPIGIARLNMVDGRILAELVLARATARSLARHLFLPFAMTEHRLARLVRLGLVQYDHRAYAPTGWEAHLPAALYAIEAKLSDWRSAVRQAAYYKQFVDKSYVALPDTFKHVLELHRECRRRGLGLILVSGSGAVEAPVDAKTSTKRIASRRAAFAVAALSRMVSEAHASAV
jgi:hypothetical protein